MDLNVTRHKDGKPVDVDGINDYFTKRVNLLFAF
jgi:hypothetical protein